MTPPTIAQVDSALVSHSMASVRIWLASQNVPMSAATPRAGFATAVQKLLAEKNISLAELNEGMIDLEEASGKRVNVFRTDITPKILSDVLKQIVAVTGGMSSQRSPAPVRPANTKRVYVIETGSTFRAKWAETHTVYDLDISLLKLVPVKHTKLIVFVMDKATGVIQIRYDTPGTTHQHGTGLKSTAVDYYQHFKDAVETLTGIALVPAEMRVKMQAVADTAPRIVKCRSLELSSDDSYAFVVKPKVRGKDIRDSADLTAMKAHGSKVKVSEVEVFTWLPQPSGKLISREIKTRVDGREAFIRFEADYHESEVNYVLGKLL